MQAAIENREIGFTVLSMTPRCRRVHSGAVHGQDHGAPVSRIRRDHRVAILISPFVEPHADAVQPLS
jgi:hypothetical protein